jgi:hypothetical protein
MKSAPLKATVFLIIYVLPKAQFYHNDDKLGADKTYPGHRIMGTQKLIPGTSPSLVKHGN